MKMRVFLFCVFFLLFILAGCAVATKTVAKYDRASEDVLIAFAPLKWDIQPSKEYFEINFTDVEVEYLNDYGMNRLKNTDKYGLVFLVPNPLPYFKKKSVISNLVVRHYDFKKIIEIKTVLGHENKYEKKLKFIFDEIVADFTKQYGTSAQVAEYRDLKKDEVINVWVLNDVVIEVILGMDNDDENKVFWSVVVRMIDKKIFKLEKERK